MRPMRLVVLVAAIGVLHFGTVLASNTPPSGTFKNCSPKGIGGDPDLNVLKNRAAQVKDPVSMTNTWRAAGKTP